MKLAEIKPDEYYALHVSAKQVERHADLLTRAVSVGDSPRLYHGRVLDIEQHRGRTLVRVELTARVLRRERLIEQRDGDEWIEWLGVVYRGDPEGKHEAVMDDRQIEALVGPQQIVCPWDEALVDAEINTASLRYLAQR
jgi:hypothetical protein